MYEEKVRDILPAEEEPEHLSIAQQFSNEMMGRFNPEQVNEILHHIKQRFKERREMEIEQAQREITEAQQKLAYLQKTMEAL